MNVHVDKTRNTKRKSAAGRELPTRTGENYFFVSMGNRPDLVAQQKLQYLASNSQQVKRSNQLQAMADDYSAHRQKTTHKNEGGNELPGDSKTGMAAIQRHAVDDVAANCRPDKPVSLRAQAYGRGRVNPSTLQEAHLPHDSWDVMQKKQRMLKPGMGLSVEANADYSRSLGMAADVMGDKGSKIRSELGCPIRLQTVDSPTDKILVARNGDDLHALEQVPAPSHKATVIQRVVEEDKGAIYNALPMEYQAHFKKSVTVFLPKDDEVIGQTRDETLNQVWARIKVNARAAAKQCKPAEDPNAVLNRWKVKDAVAALISDANSLTSLAEGDREKLHGREETKPFSKGGQVIDFKVQGIGVGEIEVISNGKFGDKDVLLFVAHGFTHGEGLSHVFSDDKKAFGFMTGRRESLERESFSIEKHKAMAKELRERNEEYEVKGVPDLVVYPHFPEDAIKGEGQFLENLTGEMDVAVLRGWRWENETDLGKKLSIAFVNTIPLTFILGSPPLNRFGKYLMQVCRADWSREVPVSGGSRRTSAKLTKW